MLENFTGWNKTKVQTAETEGDEGAAKKIRKEGKVEAKRVAQTMKKVYTGEDKGKHCRKLSEKMIAKLMYVATSRAKLRVLITGCYSPKVSKFNIGNLPWM